MYPPQRPFPPYRWTLCLLASAVLLGACLPGSDRHIQSARAAVDEAEAQIALAREAEDAGRQNESGEFYLSAQEHLQAAREHYLTARADRSSDTQLLEEFAALAVRTQDYDLAARAYRRAAKFSPETTQYWLEAGRNFVRVGSGMSGEAREALEVCQDRAEASGDTGLAVEVDTQLGHLYRHLALYELAREHYESALAADAEALGARIALLGLDFREGRVREAATATDRVGGLLPAEAAYLDSMLHFGYEGFHETRASFEDRAENHMAYAKLLTRLNRLSEALFAFQRAAELDQDNVVALNFLGSIAQQMGDTDRARQAFERSLEVDPDQARTRDALQALSAPPQ